MKLSVQSPAIHVELTDDEGAVIYRYSADQLHIELNTEKLIGAVGELFEQAEEVAKKVK